MKPRSIAQRIVYSFAIIFFTIMAIVGLGFGCAGETQQLETVQVQETPKETMPKEESGTSCQVIKKSFADKRGNETGHMELYLRCSAQDYFIKFCESEVSKREVKRYLNSEITVDMDIKEGEWDPCPGKNFPIQSRVGSYVTIKKIIK